MISAQAHRAVKISEHVYWVGAIDWGIRDFHGYSTPRGTTYNAYLVTGDDFILIDTVKAPFHDEMMSRVASVTSPDSIRYLVSNHAEMDHSGSFPRVVKAVKPEKVFASARGVKALEAHFHLGLDINPVASGEKVELGGLNFTFLETRMLHWPDSMMCYLAGDGVLFSQDGFGMHLASSSRFADELPTGILEEENRRYFANILLPYAPVLLKALARIASSGLEIRMIAPDHGPIWRDPKGIKRFLGWYDTLARQEPCSRAVVAYDSMWGSTAMMANAAAEGLAAEGIEVACMSLKSSHRSDIMAELACSGAFLAGTPTLNNNIFPSMADIMTYARGLKPRNLVGAAFGSYGWSGEGAKQLDGLLGQMKVEIAAGPLSVNYVPDPDSLAGCRAMGTEVALRLKEVLGNGR